MVCVPRLELAAHYRSRQSYSSKRTFSKNLLLRYNALAKEGFAMRIKEMFDKMTKAFAEFEGVTEQIKTDNQLE